MKYKLISNNSAESLSAQVNKYLEIGWELYKHPSCDISKVTGKDNRNYTFVNESTIYIQALVNNNDVVWYLPSDTPTDSYLNVMLKDETILQTSGYCNGNFIVNEIAKHPLIQNGMIHKFKVKCWSVNE